MNDPERAESLQNWRYLWGLKVAAQSVSELYISVALLGGHYVRVSKEEFLDAINNMQAVSDSHPHPTRFNFTIENNIMWVHSSMMPVKKTELDNDRQVGPEDDDRNAVS